MSIDRNQIAEHSGMLVPDSYNATPDDMSVRRGAGRSRLPDNAMASDTLRSIGDAIVTTDICGSIVYLNPVAERLTGWTSAEAAGCPLDSVMKLRSEVTLERITNIAERCLNAGHAIDLEEGVVLLRRDGTEVPIGDSVAPIRNPAGEMTGVVLVVQDESQKRRVGNRLSYEATHDMLTGLTNRREFERRLAQLIDGLYGKTDTHSLLYLDLDRFKVVNDTCGHDAGDALLRMLGPMISEELRSGDTLARLGGDEFGVLLTNCSLAEAEQIAERIREALEALQFAWENVAFSISASIGVFLVKGTRDSLADVVRGADAACYVAKRGGGNNVRIGSPASSAGHTERGIDVACA